MDKQMLIGSRFETGTETEEHILNPKTGETVVDLAEASHAQIDAAVDAAEKAFVSWSMTTPGERSGYLLKIADTVPALKGNAAFQKAVKDGTYDTWAQKMSDSFNTSGVTGTPTAKLDGKTVNVVTNTGIMPAEQLMASIKQQIGASK